MAKSSIWPNPMVDSRRVVVSDDSHVIDVATYVGNKGTHVSVSPERAIYLAYQLLDAALRVERNNIKALDDFVIGPVTQEPRS